MQGPLLVLMFAPLGVNIWDLVLICSYTFGFGLGLIRNNINLYNRLNTNYLGLTDTDFSVSVSNRLIGITLHHRKRNRKQPMGWGMACFL